MYIYIYEPGFRTTPTPPRPPNEDIPPCGSGGGVGKGGPQQPQWFTWSAQMDTQDTNSIAPHPFYYGALMPLLHTRKQLDWLQDDRVALSNHSMSVELPDRRRKPHGKLELETLEREDGRVREGGGGYPS